MTRLATNSLGCFAGRVGEEVPVDVAHSPAYPDLLRIEHFTRDIDSRVRLYG
jgi:hypothetical protein